MKKRYWFITGALVTLLVFGGCYYYYQEQEANSTTSEVSKKSITATEWDISQLTSSTGDNIQVLDYSDLSIASISDIYNVDNQNVINDKIDNLKASSTYTLDNPLIISDPYLTNTTGLYVYFETTDAMQVSYTVEAEGYEDYSATLYNSSGTYATSHDYQIIGAVSGVENKITLTTTAEDGTQSRKSFTYTPNKVQSTVSNTYDVEEGDSTKELSNGLFAVIGNQASDTIRSTYYLDNNGVVRAEIPILGYNSMRLNFTSDNQMYLGLNSSKIAKMTNLGQVTKVIDVASQGFSLHHDFVLDSDGNILALATSQEKEETDNIVEDQVIKIDTQSGTIKNTIDFENLLPDLYSVATDLEEHSNNIGKLDPIHLNTIQVLDNNTIIVSSRETSSIIKVDNITTTPSVSYMISDESVWDGVGDYSNLLLTKLGNFVNNAGQHTVTYETDSSLEDGQYYLYMFDNNSSLMDSRSDFDWSAYKTDDTTDIDVDDDASMYYKYLVDENAGTYRLVDSFEIPYSSYVSSTQDYNGNIVIAPGSKNQVIEYDSSGDVIRSLTYTGESLLTYRTLKYSFNNFYFTE